MAGEKSTFWPDEGGRAAMRLGRAFLLAPILTGCLVTLAAFLIAGMSEPTKDGVIDVTLTTATTLVPAMFVFMLTFGAAGVCALWYLALRGLFAWTVGGALSGMIAIILAGELLLQGGVQQSLLIAAAVGGWIMFLLFRWIAGIRTD